MNLLKALWNIMLIGLIAAGIWGLVQYHKQLLAFSNSILGYRELNAAIAERRWHEAHHLCDLALAKKPDDLDLLQKMAHIQTQEQTFIDAEETYQRALKLSPTDVDTLTHYAQLLGSLGRFNEGLMQLRKALRSLHREGKTSQEVLNTLGATFKLAAENPNESRKSLQNWLYDWSRYYYTLSLKENPDQFIPHFNLGVIAQQTNQPEKAATHYCKAVILSPKSYEVRYNFGLALVSIRLYDQGYRQLDQAIRMLGEGQHVTEAHHLAEEAQRIKNSVFQSGRMPLNETEKNQALSQFDTRCLIETTTAP